MLSFYGPISRLVISRYKFDFNSKYSLQICPQFGSKSITIVAGDQLASSIPGQPPPDEGVGAVETGGLGDWNAFQPPAFTVQEGQNVTHSFGLRERSDYVDVEFLEPAVRYFKNSWLRYVLLFWFY